MPNPEAVGMLPAPDKLTVHRFFPELRRRV